MKNFLSVALIIAAFLIVGCGSEKSAENPPAEPKVEQPAPEPEKVAAVAADGTIWAIDEENVKYLADALARDDNEYLKQLSVEQKVFFVDRDTKVTRIGEATADGFVMVKFNEGRYTNKEGYTFAYNIFTEAEYPAFVEARAAKAQEKRQKVFDVIYTYVMNTDGYFEFITAGNVDEVKRIWDWIDKEQYTIIALKNDKSVDSDIRECAKKAHRLVLDRSGVISTYLRNGYRNEVEYQKAEKLRQEFRDKYGY